MRAVARCVPGGRQRGQAPNGPQKQGTGNRDGLEAQGGGLIGKTDLEPLQDGREGLTRREGGWEQTIPGRSPLLPQQICPPLQPLLPSAEPFCTYSLPRGCLAPSTSPEAGEGRTLTIHVPSRPSMGMAGSARPRLHTSRGHGGRSSNELHSCYLGL